MKSSYFSMAPVRPLAVFDEYELGQVIREITCAECGRPIRPGQMALVGKSPWWNYCSWCAFPIIHGTGETAPYRTADQRRM